MGVGGLVRGRDKKWLSGFMGFVGLGSPLEAELLAVLAALKFAWDKGWRNLILESDCLEVVNIFKPADWLACKGARAEDPIKWLDVPPPAVDTLVVLDFMSGL
ncbi:Ribonuclease H-like superfamily [Sesbania bispinosa]|nr:Ribonuclease H-like superfamily [Sesbania bispinosa]